ncbi:MAG: D-tyrosyl-tRNA(Tyr) deacylase [Dehalococcoidia bacterium]|nr:MAG: D-tyrosyl-tRNA(Tyr) deacylase [Dehalococcoidia bacterium]
MRVVLQRVTRASVTVGDEVAGAIGPGLVMFAGIAQGDDAACVRRMARKCAELRLFPNDAGRFDRSLTEIGGEALVVSQFTLLADVRKGRRPSFIAAADPAVAEPLIEEFAEELRRAGVRVAGGRFGAMMHVESVNDGPVTVIVDSDDLDRPRRAHTGV